MDSITRNQTFLLRVVSSCMIISGYFLPWRYFYVVYSGERAIYGFNEAGEIMLALSTLTLFATLANYKLGETGVLHKIVSLTGVAATLFLSYKTYQFFSFDYEASGHRLILGAGFYMNWIGCILLLLSIRSSIFSQPSIK